MTSSSAVATSALARPGVAIALAAAVAAASWAFYYYRFHHLAVCPDPSSGPSPSPSLHRRNAVRRPPRASRQPDDSSGADSPHDVENESGPVPTDAPDPLAVAPSPDASPDDRNDVWNDEPGHTPRERTGENIVALLFRVSEDNARRNAYVHRGCLCNGCGMLPIRGIRYRCANCPDYDLCEMCESMGSHNKTHVFYKVKVPVPSSTARHVQPPWYPGDPNIVTPSLPRHLLSKWSKETGFERVELDALWEQWTFMANTEWKDDPNALCLAMDRKTFERCLVPSAGSRHPAPNLIHDRMFAFYDTNHDDLIGFEEFLHGVSYKKRRDKLRRTFDGYDIDGDGYVTRRDFLRMFRAYYVSYKQMHRDTVEGLDDYMMTNIDVHQLVNSRQPMSSIFGRDHRIPDGDSDRMMDGKIFRSTGDVELSDGKGPVSEDKPDTSSREDVLRDLFTRNSHTSHFTESFEHSHRSQSPSAIHPYWAGLLNPPHSTVELATLISGEYTQFDDIIDTFRQQAHGILSGDDAESGSSEDGDGQSSHDDRIDEEGEASHHSVTNHGDSVASPRLPDARQFVNELPIEVQLELNPELSVTPQRSDRRKRVMARKQLLDRWKRRQFYLDEEEGGLPPPGWRDDQDVLVNANAMFESSKSAPPFLSPRSRSSSKVRFVEDTDDFETRSNPSTSSRSVPERWGGMEIPDAERDAGKEILYQVTQQAFNELLDALFKKKEDIAMLAAETKEVREKYRELLDNFDGVHMPDEIEKPAVEPSPRSAIQQAPVRRPVQDLSLQELLDVTGYTVESRVNTDGSPAPRTNQSDNQLGQNGQSNHAESIQPTVAMSPETCTGGDSEYRDPTMPQFMPNSAPPEDDGISTQILDDNNHPESSSPATHDTLQTVPPTSSPIQISASQLELWKAIDRAEQAAIKQGGWGRLSYAEFEEIYREHEFQDGTKNRLAYLGNWIDFCIPS